MIEEGIEAQAHRVHRHGIQLNRTSRVVVFLKTGVEDFPAETDTLSLIDTIVDKAYALKSDEQAQEFIDSAVSKMVEILGLPSSNKTSETFCKAWLVDELDIKVDLKRPDPQDRWANHIRYPRLSRLAQSNPDAFRKFQQVMSRFVGLPDLASANPPKPSSRSFTTSCYA